MSGQIRNLLAETIKMYEMEGCGICEKPGADMFWFSSVSRCAHSVCYEKIKDVEANLTATINSLFDRRSRNMAHSEAIRVINSSIKIYVYVKICGHEEHIFST